MDRSGHRTIKPPDQAKSRLNGLENLALSSVDRSEAKWKRNAGIYTTQLIRASLDKQPKTVKYLEEAFGVSMRKYVR
jgi:hypothetical protein